MKKLLTFILILASFAAGVYVGRLPASDIVFSARAEDPVQTDTAPDSAEERMVSAESAQEPMTVSQSQLSPEQRALLTKLGIDADSITITAEMIACAEAKLGAARLAEIQGGATPAFAEGASLLACYR